jgi:N-sulfoglucosamine sulfohydrolase
MMRFSLWAVLFMTLLQCKQKSNDQLKANILFAVADDASYPHMSAYGTSWVKTPAFDRVAAEGILFNNCYTPNAKCAPSRACILTGRNSWQLEEAANHVPYFPAKFKTYAEALAENGYHVGYTAKGWAPGVALSEEGKKRFLTGKAYNEFSTNPPARHISNNDYSTNFEAFLDDNPEGKPFCFWYGSTEPHRAYEFGAGIAQGLKELTDIDQVAAFWPDNDTVRTDLLDYAFEIEYFDHHLQKMLQMLEKGVLWTTHLW